MNQEKGLEGLPTAGKKHPKKRNVAFVARRCSASWAARIMRRYVPAEKGLKTK